MSLHDRINRTEFVDKIYSVIDSIEKNDNCCIAVDGAWGSGKSFVLTLLEERLSLNRANIIIKYDAWENSFYPDPLIAILSCVIDGLESKLSKMRGYAKAALEVGKKKSREIINKLSDSGGKIGVLATVIKEITEIIPNFKNALLVSDTKDAQLEVFKSYKLLLTEVKRLLDILTKKVFVEHEQTKLVVIVDEIDRCLPDEQLKILERLHHLFDVKNCAVVVALNKKCVAETVTKIYGANGYEYLNKFFNITFYLEKSTNIYLNSLFEEFAETNKIIRNGVNITEISTKLSLFCITNSIMIDKFKILSGLSNRDIKEYFVSLCKIYKAINTEQLNSIIIFFIQTALFIRKFISKTFLNEADVKKNQDNFNDAPLTPYDMPYYDYIFNLMGVKKGEHYTNAVYPSFSYTYVDLGDYVWCFNLIVCKSACEITNRRCNDAAHWNRYNATDCKRLCNLVILYGGDSNKNTGDGK